MIDFCSTYLLSCGEETSTGFLVSAKTGTETVCVMVTVLSLFDGAGKHDVSIANLNQGKHECIVLKDVQPAFDYKHGLAAFTVSNKLTSGLYPMLNAVPVEMVVPGGLPGIARVCALGFPLYHGENTFPHSGQDDWFFAPVALSGVKASYPDEKNDMFLVDISEEEGFLGGPVWEETQDGWKVGGVFCGQAMPLLASQTIASAFSVVAPAACVQELVQEAANKKAAA